MEVNTTRLLKVFIGAGAAVGLLCATAQGQTDPLISGNNALFSCGNSPIATTDFPTGETVDFNPDGAKIDCHNGRGVLVLGNKVYYTELTSPPTAFGPTDSIRVAPFNGGTGGPDIPGAALTNPRPGCGVQDLAYHDGYIYALTGYRSDFLPACTSLQVFKIAVGGGSWIGPVTIPAPGNFLEPGTSADGFTILVTNGVITFLINDGDGSCQYREYDSTTGAPIDGHAFLAPGGDHCTGVDTLDSDTDGTHVLYFSHASTISSATLLPSWAPPTLGTVFTPGDGWQFVEDISLVHGFAGTPGAANCHGQSVSELATTFGGKPNAASALGYSSVNDLQDGIRAFCGD
jgi:hypothetical protein